jgi:hypothetical protein
LLISKAELDAGETVSLLRVLERLRASADLLDLGQNFAFAISPLSR